MPLEVCEALSPHRKRHVGGGGSIDHKLQDLQLFLRFPLFLWYCKLVREMLLISILRSRCVCCTCCIHIHQLSFLPTPFLSAYLRTHISHARHNKYSSPHFKGSPLNLHPDCRIYVKGTALTPFDANGYLNSVDQSADSSSVLRWVSMPIYRFEEGAHRRCRPLMQSQHMPFAMKVCTRTYAHFVEPSFSLDFHGCRFVQ